MYRITRSVTCRKFGPTKQSFTPFLCGKRGFASSTLPPIEEQVVTDHKEINAFYDSYEDAVNRNNFGDANRWYHQLVWALARHNVAEELILYPMYEDKLGDWGKKRADDSRKEHLEVKNILTVIIFSFCLFIFFFLIFLQELERMNGADPNFPVKLRHMMFTVKSHMEHEEKDELVKFKDNVPTDERVLAGISFERRKMIAPTHPHPHAPDTGHTFETLVSVFTTPIDLMRDMFRDFPDKGEVKEAQEKAKQAKE